MFNLKYTAKPLIVNRSQNLLQDKKLLWGMPPSIIANLIIILLATSSSTRNEKLETFIMKQVRLEQIKGDFLLKNHARDFSTD